MRPSAHVTIFLSLAVVACDGDDAPVCLCDGGSIIWDDGWDLPCDPVAQTGCLTGEKCTWQEVTDTLGRLACVPTGSVAIGSSCMSMPPGETAGYDDCIAGAYCLSGTCQEICADAPDSCDTAISSCSVYSGLFEGAQYSTGLCDFKCEPGPQTRLADGAVSCGSTPEHQWGCYGWAWGVSPVDFVCMLDISEAQHGDPPDPLSPQPLLNSCDAGYFPWVASFEDTAPDVCIAFCTPGETHAGDTTNLDGVAPFTCAGRGAIGSAIECRFLHIFDVTPPRAQYNGSGVCLAPSAYTSNWDDDPGTADTPLPRCAELTNTTMVDSDGNGVLDTPEHEYWGCAPWTDPADLAVTGRSSGNQAGAERSHL